jgi:hypothetical protein
MTHSAFSKTSWGMFSGVFMISCITTPEFSRRLCSLLFAAQIVAVASARPAMRIDLRSMLTSTIGIAPAEVVRIALEISPAEGFR